MAKNPIYGIGNALVDAEFHVSEEDLSYLGIEKGVMTLIDASRHQQLTALLSPKLKARACGGSAANTIITCAQLGHEGFYSCRVTNDDNGQFYIQDMQANGVSTNVTLQGEPEGQTGQCVVMVTDDAERTMNTYLGVTADFSAGDICYETLKDSDYLYVEGYLVSSKTGFAAAIDAIQFAKQHGIKTAFSFSDPNMVQFCLQQMQEIIELGVDVLFCNHAEAQMFTNMDSNHQAIEALQHKASMVVLTQGRDGVLVASTEGVQHVAGVEVEALDSNGAGDTFAGAFLTGLLDGYTIDQAARLANFCAAQVVTQYGPRLSGERLQRAQQFKASL